jgi:pimeloyl-ACP methyl ester carboxylesterase
LAHRALAFRLTDRVLAKLLAALFAHLMLGSVLVASATAGTPEVRRGFVSVSAPGHERLRLYVEERGEGRPIVLLHGFGASSYAWRFLAPRLARSNRVIAIDLKGFGRSEKPVDGRYSVVEQARTVRAFLQQQGLTDISLVGHSLGGAIALAIAVQTAASEPNLVRDLTLIAAPVYPQAIPDTIAALQTPGTGEFLLGIIPPDLIARLTLIGASAPGRRVDPADVAAYAEPLKSEGGKAALIASARTFDPLRYSFIIARIPRLRKPALLIWCRNDVIVPLATGLRLKREIRGSALAVLDRCNHLSPEERPAEVTRLIRAFLAR